MGPVDPNVLVLSTCTKIMQLLSNANQFFFLETVISSYNVYILVAMFHHNTKGKMDKEIEHECMGRKKNVYVL